MNQAIIQENIFGIYQNAANKNTSLSNISKEHPYCAMAHYFALKNNDVESNKELAAKSSLFFKNNFYLQILLQENNSMLQNLQITNIEATETPVVKEPVIIFEEQILNTKVIETKIGGNIEVENSEPNLPQLNITKEADTTETEIKFEPLHTSDYFASQGIKLSNVVLPNDKLGMQLKSFTSWLKTMKKTHPEKLPTNNILGEVAIQKQAENSNIDVEIYTEPMAEAYVQQGKNIKAIEIYSKLSLMFPEKSAFFADKIENLKK